MNKSSDFSVFSKCLRELRARLSLTQKEFAQRVGITPATLSAYENGVKSPPVSTVIRIAEEYKISLDWLCGIEQSEMTIGGALTQCEKIILLMLGKYAVYSSEKQSFEIKAPGTDIEKFMLSVMRLIKADLDQSMLKVCLDVAIKRFEDVQKNENL